MPSITVTPVPPTPDAFPSYPAPQHIELKCILAIVVSCLAFVGAVLVSYCYVRLRNVLRRPTLDCLVLTIMLAIPGSLNIIVGAALRLHSPSMHGFCEWNFYLFQQFTLVEIMMEGFFFAAIAWTLVGGSLTHIGVRRAFAFALLCGCIAGAAPLADLPPNHPSTGTPLGSSLPWCWLPQYDRVDSDGNWTISPKLTWFKFAYGYMWAILAMICGLASCVALLKRYRSTNTRPHPTVKWRFAYCFIFAAGWLTCLVPRIFGSKLPQDTVNDLELVLAVVAPGMPFFNAVLFFVLEVPLDMIRHPQAFEDADCAYDAMHLTIQGSTVLVDPLNSDSQTQSLSTVHNGNVSPRKLGTERAIDEVHRAAAEAEAAQQPLIEARYNEEDQLWIIDMTHTRFAPDTDEGRAQQLALSALEETAQKQNQVVALVENLPKPPISAAMALVGGYCDACGFVSMELFTAHVTGNLVLIGVDVANSQKVPLSALWPKVAAVPVFCVGFAVGYSLNIYTKHWHRRVELFMMFAFFLMSFGVAIKTGPYDVDVDGYTPGAWAAGLLMVLGMSIHNAYQRHHLVGLPMTGFMTGNTNQLVFDFIEIYRKRRVNPKDPALTKLYERVRVTGMVWIAFFIGCMSASGIYRIWGMWAFLPPSIIVAAIIIIFWDETSMPNKKN